MVKYLHNVCVKSSIQSPATYALDSVEHTSNLRKKQENQESKIILENIVRVRSFKVLKGGGRKRKRERGESKILR